MCDNFSTQCRCAVDGFISAGSGLLTGGEQREERKGEKKRVRERRKEAREMKETMEKEEGEGEEMPPVTILRFNSHSIHIPLKYRAEEKD